MDHLRLIGYGRTCLVEAFRRRDDTVLASIFHPTYPSSFRGGGARLGRGGAGLRGDAKKSWIVGGGITVRQTQHHQPSH